MQTTFSKILLRYLFLFGTFLVARRKEKFLLSRLDLETKKKTK